MLPDPVGLASSDYDADWIRSHEFDRTVLVAAEVVEMLVGMTSFGLLRKSRGKIEAQLATGGGNLEPVSFTVKRSATGERVRLEVARA